MTITLESLTAALLDWVKFLSCKEIVVLTSTCKFFKETFDSNASVWECLYNQPLYIKNNRLNLPRAQRNRQFVVWHLYLWQKIISASSFIYLLCNIDSYSFASGLIRVAFNKIQRLSQDEILRHYAHKLQLHVMISNHLLTTNLDDQEEMVEGLNALTILSRPFNDIIVNPDIFASTSPNVICLCIIRAITTYQHDTKVLESAFNACTNLSLNHIHATYFISQGFCDYLMSMILFNNISDNRVVLLAGVNCLKNIYDLLHIAVENLETIIKITIIVSRANDPVVLLEYMKYLNDLAVWQFPHMQSQELSEFLSEIISQNEKNIEKIKIKNEIENDTNNEMKKENNEKVIEIVNIAEESVFSSEITENSSNESVNSLAKALVSKIFNDIPV